MIHSGNEMIFNGTRGGSPDLHPTDVNRQSTAPPLSAVRFWNVAATSADEGEITLYGDILPETPRDWWTDKPLEGRWVTPEGFDEALAAVRNKKNVTVRINSLGGDLYTGIAIHDALKDLPARVTVIVEGIAASAASVIAMAGDEIRLHPGDTIMIHGVAALLVNYYGLDDLKKIVRSFEAAEKAIARIYAERTGLTEERLREMMSRETWMVGKDAVELGFADTLIGEAGPGLVASADRRVLLVAGVRHDVTGLHLPEWIKSVEIAGAGSDGECRMQNKEYKIEGGDTPHPMEDVSEGRQDGRRPEGGAAGAAHLDSVRSAPGAGEIASGEIACEGEIPLRGVENGDAGAKSGKGEALPSLLTPHPSPHTAAEGGLNRIQSGSVPGGNTFVHEEDEAMTLEELRAQQPELVAQIEAAAAENARAAAIRDERARLQAIEEIERTVGDADMIRDAKYGEHPMTAEQLALAALRQQAALGANVAAALVEDTKAAKTAAVGADGKVGENNEIETPEQRRAAGRAAVKA